MGVFYAEDWKDFAEMEVPYLFDLLIIADSGAAERGRANWKAGWTPPKPSNKVDHTSGELRKRDSSGLEMRAEGDESNDKVEVEVEEVENLPMWAAPFVGLKAPQGWWAPARTALLSYLGLPPDSFNGDDSNTRGKKNKKGKGSIAPVLTYVSMQDEPKGAGPRLNGETHDELLQGLRRFEADGILGEVHVVRGNGTREVWENRMSAIARSQVHSTPSFNHDSTGTDMLASDDLDHDWDVWSTYG